MKTISLIIYLTLVYIPIVAQTETNSQKIETIKEEIKKKFTSFNGSLEEQSIEKWDTYFLKSDQVGNIHHPIKQVGWDKFHLSMDYFFKTKPKGEVRFTNLEIHPINDTTAWVIGDYELIINGKSIKTKFHDSLIKTKEGWRVFCSVVIEN